MTFSAKKIFLSKFMFWIIIALAGTYYLLPNLFLSNTQNRFALSRLKLGIDLRGGTYIILGINIEKAIENRLATELHNLDHLLQKEPKYQPVKKDLDNKKLSIVMSYKTTEDAKIAHNFIKDSTQKGLISIKTSVQDINLIGSLLPAEENRIRNESVEQAIYVISNRVQSFGVEGIVVQRHGTRQIVVQLPGVDDPERVKNLITKRAHLEFKIVQDSGRSKAELLDKFDGDLPSDKRIIPGEKSAEYEDDETEGMWYLVSAFPALTGDHITDARIGYEEFGQPYVKFTLDRSGGKIFKDVTRNNLKRQLGIIIDNVMYSAPEINAEIGSEGRITLGRSSNVEAAKDLAIVLKAGAFQAPVTYLEERRIGPSLGQDSINQGFMACLVGLILVFLFSLLYYKVGGIMASLALLYNLLLILLFLAYFGATLTLPGIAGIVLTIGMAIDASILIYEKIREDFSEGVSFRSAVDSGFKGAMAVIIDSNITTFLTGLVLFYFGGPGIRGFAVTLMLGIVATLLAGIYFLKALFDFVLDNTNLKLIKL